MVQPFLPEVLKVLYDKTPSVRQAALATITLVIRHGLSNPTDIIPCTIALTADRSPGTCQKSRNLLQFISEKHSSFLQLRVVDGLKDSFEFQKKNYGSASVYSNGWALSLNVKFYGSKRAEIWNRTPGQEPFMSNVYQLFKAKSKYPVLQSILRSFEDTEKVMILSNFMIMRETALIGYRIIWIIWNTRRKPWQRCPTQRKTRWVISGTRDDVVWDVQGFIYCTSHQPCHLDSVHTCTTIPEAPLQRILHSQIKWEISSKFLSPTLTPSSHQVPGTVSRHVKLDIIAVIEGLSEKQLWFDWCQMSRFRTSRKAGKDFCKATRCHPFRRNFLTFSASHCRSHTRSIEGSIRAGNHSNDFYNIKTYNIPMILVYKIDRVTVQFIVERW